MTGRTPQVVLLADLDPERPWSPDLAGWLAVAASPARPVGWTAPAGAVVPAAGPVADLLRTGALVRVPEGAPAALLAVHLDSWTGRPVPAWPQAGSRLLLDAGRLRRMAAGAVQADPPSLLAALLGAGPERDDEPDPGPQPELQPGPQQGAAPVLFVSSNGTGMGHLTRLLAMARRAGPGVAPVFASMSQAVPVVGSGDAGVAFGWEYIPSKGDLGIGIRRWNVLFERRFGELVERRRPAAVVFDGTYPYDGLLAAADRVPGLKLVWSRRGMWRADATGGQLARSGRFDLVVEPGDLAAEEDRGATARRTDALRVDPVTLLDREEMVSREEAAAVLGVDPDRPTALLTLSKGAVEDPTQGLGLVVAKLAAVPGLQVVLTRPVIASALGPISDRVHAVSVYPIARYLAAVDLAVSACGYNSFHELLGSAVPTAFVPGPVPLDDQPARARWAQRAGVGLHLTELTPPAVDAMVEVMADRVRRERMAQRCRELRRPNGAAEAMAAVSGLLTPEQVR